MSEAKETLQNRPTSLRFVYSRPYESALLKLEAKIADKEYEDKLRKNVETASEVWKEHEVDVLQLFGEIYKIDIPKDSIEVFISQAAPNSYSHPMTISLKRLGKLEVNERQQRGLVYTVTHELAHYFLYTRKPSEYANSIWKQIRKQDLLGDYGTNLHFLIQAVEFGIIGEVFGEDYAEYARDFVIKNHSPQYIDSAQALIDHRVPLDKTCLEYIEKDVLSQNSSSEKQLRKEKKPT